MNSRTPCKETEQFRERERERGLTIAARTIGPYSTNTEARSHFFRQTLTLKNECCLNWTQTPVWSKNCSKKSKPTTEFSLKMVVGWFTSFQNSPTAKSESVKPLLFQFNKNNGGKRKNSDKHVYTILLIYIHIYTCICWILELLLLLRVFGWDHEKQYYLSFYLF